ncbi:MAG: CoB--CoM heterodisulfide reductase iron-sulfur subunit A family protein [Deltaproteobacteria bacterium]|nr:CoB--CoM heterodisulfide reductase iron-sulfur subunit A family protein [Deltaproteobacteria bacterium]
MSDNGKRGTARSPILVVGGGISGITAAIEAAETGFEVVLVEQNPFLGGRAIQMGKYFPKLCPPICGMEINFQRIRRNPKLRLYTQAEVKAVSGEPGDFEVTLHLAPRYVTQRCTACGKCVEACPVERDNAFNYGLDRTRAIYLPHPMSVPMKYVIDDSVCPGGTCARCVPACPAGAIELDNKSTILRLKVASIIMATGWRPYDAGTIENLGFGRFPNVITNVMMERLAALDGHTEGKITRPSDGKEARDVAFVQCAGSRDENHLPYCSAVCCLVSMKQALYVRGQNPDARVWIFYIDVRTPGCYEDFYLKVKADEGVRMVKGKVAVIKEDLPTRNLIVEAEDTSMGSKLKVPADLVVLATGMVPNQMDQKTATLLRCDEYGFMSSVAPKGGIYAGGVANAPADVAFCVRNSTGISLKAIQDVVRYG